MDLDDAYEMKSRGITWTPTIVAFRHMADCARKGNPDSRVNHYTKFYRRENYYYYAERTYGENFKKLYDTGITVACGTDMYIPDQSAYPIPTELGYMVEYGISPLQAIETATKNNGEALRMNLKLGQIEEGYLADIIVVEGNPAEKIAALENVKEVYLDGKCVKSA
jgi:imidazolonepropionase-like amidohydrolase